VVIHGLKAFWFAVISQNAVQFTKINKMDNTVGSLKFCSYNCRSLKSSLLDVQNLSKLYDVVLLQEHWLLPFELGMLNDINSDFMAFGVSAVNISEDILRGRPYGGTAILYNKSLASNITIVDCHVPRMCAIMIDTSSGPILLINVYMPTDLSDDDSYVEYIDMCTKIIAVFSSSNAVSFTAIGDFNCRPDSRFYKIFNQFLTEHDLVCVDHTMLNNAFTYISDDGMRSSWIDHIICSRSLVCNFTDVKVLYGTVSSDHRPLCANLLCSMSDNPRSSTDSRDRWCKSTPSWGNATDDHVNRYRITLDKCLSNINIPNGLLSCTGACNNADHRKSIDSYYTYIIHCVSSATKATIPTVTTSKK